MESLTNTQASFKGMIYGVSGVGKTVHAMMMAQDITPTGKDILYIDTAEGWVSLQNHPQLKKRTTRMRFINIQQLEALCHAYRMNVEDFTKYGCIIVDEVSSAADNTLDEIVRYRASQDHTKDPDTPTQPDYNTTTIKVRRAINDLLTLTGVHVILVSHVRKDKDNRNIEVQSPSFLPKLGVKIKQPLHLITHLSGNEIDEETYVRIFQVHPTRTIDAKTRIGGLKPQVQYDELILKTKGWLAGEVMTERSQVRVPDHDPENPMPVEIAVEGDIA